MNFGLICLIIIDKHTPVASECHSRSYSSLSIETTSGSQSLVEPKHPKVVTHSAPNSISIVYIPLHGHCQARPAILSHPPLTCAGRRKALVRQLSVAALALHFSGPRRAGEDVLRQYRIVGGFVAFLWPSAAVQRNVSSTLSQQGFVETIDCLDKVVIQRSNVRNIVCSVSKERLAQRSVHPMIVANSWAVS